MKVEFQNPVMSSLTHCSTAVSVLKTAVSQCIFRRQIEILQLSGSSGALKKKIFIKRKTEMPFEAFLLT